MRASTVTQQIKNFVLTEARMDKVGIAPVERFNESPEGQHPTDFLPGCKSVVVFCCRLPDGAINATYRAFEDLNYGIHGIYGAYGYVGAPNYNLLFANYKVSRFVEKVTGCAAVPNPAGPTHGAKMMSMRHCGYAAGLGEIGWSSLVLTPEFGPRNRFGAVLTTAELDPDPMYSGPKLCDPSKCRACVEMCPTGAIQEYQEGAERIICTGGREDKYGLVNWAKCRIMCHGTGKDYNESGTDLVPQEGNPLDEDLSPIGAYFNANPRQNFHQHNPTWKCGNCLSYCPVGSWYQRFQDTGLTKTDMSEMDKMTHDDKEV